MEEWGDAVAWSIGDNAIDRNLDRWNVLLITVAHISVWYQYSSWEYRYNSHMNVFLKSGEGGSLLRWILSHMNYRFLWSQAYLPTDGEI